MLAHLVVGADPWAALLAMATRTPQVDGSAVAAAPAAAGVGAGSGAA